MSKYRSIRTTVNGITFHSRGEAGRYRDLLLMEQAGLITDLELQPSFVLQENIQYTDPSGKTEKERKIIYTADFKYFDNEIQCLVIEDFKGAETKDYIIKRKIFKAHYGEQYVFRISRTE